MNVAILNLPIDKNYGGNLQRFALSKIIEQLGHKVSILNCQYSEENKSLNPIGHFKSIIKKILFRIPFFAQKKWPIQNFQNNKYNHTKKIFTKKELEKYNFFDAFIVGSDQVWRKDYTLHYGLETYFLDFVEKKKRKIAYGVSFGKNSADLSNDEIQTLRKLYNQFYAVSVRENSALNLLNEYSWTTPKGVLVLDPTFLLRKNDYELLAKKGNVQKSPGNLFCYILDRDEEKEQTINNIAKKKNLTPFSIDMKSTRETSIEQWIQSFIDSEFIITDSYHGLVFSLIFNKPFFLINNKTRGSARFETLFHLFDITENGESIHWDALNKQIEILRFYSIEFLKGALNPAIS